MHGCSSLQKCCKMPRYLRFFRRYRLLSELRITEEALDLAVEEHDVVSESAHIVLGEGERCLRVAFFTLW